MADMRKCQLIKPWDMSREIGGRTNDKKKKEKSGTHSHPIIHRVIGVSPQNIIKESELGHKVRSEVSGSKRNLL